MKRFSTPTSKPITIGDQFTLFRKSVQKPVVPVVDDVKPEEKEQVKEEPVAKENGDEKEDTSAKDTSEEGAAEKSGEKRKAESDLESGTNKKEKDGGSETAAVSGTSTTLEGSSSKDGQGSDGVHAEREQDSPKQETETVSSGSEVQ